MVTKQIKIDEKLKKKLDKLKTHKRETYGDVIENMTDAEIENLLGKQKKEITEKENKARDLIKNKSLEDLLKFILEFVFHHNHLFNWYYFDCF